MTDLIYDYITMGVDLMINAMVLTTVIVLLYNANILSQISSAQQANSDRVNYYKEYAKFDCTSDLSCADILSAMSYYKNDHYILVVTGGQTLIATNGEWYIDNLNNKTNMHTVSNILGSVDKYNAWLYEDNWLGNSGNISYSGYEGGIISGIYFKKAGLP